MGRRPIDESDFHSRPSKRGSRPRTKTRPEHEDAVSGLVTGVDTEDVLEAIWAALEADPGREITVDLETRTVAVGDLQASFEIDDYTRWRLLEGLDDIGLTLRSEDQIAQFEARREAWRPRTLPVR